MQKNQQAALIKVKEEFEHLTKNAAAETAEL